MRGALIGFGILGVLVGLGFVFPAVAQWRIDGALSASPGAFLALGTVLTLAGVGAVVYGIMPRQAKP